MNILHSFVLSFMFSSDILFEKIKLKKDFNWNVTFNMSTTPNRLSVIILISPNSLLMKNLFFIRYSK